MKIGTGGQCPWIWQKETFGTHGELNLERKGGKNDSNNANMLNN